MDQKDVCDNLFYMWMILEKAIQDHSEDICACGMCRFDKHICYGIEICLELESSLSVTKIISDFRASNNPMLLIILDIINY